MFALSSFLLYFSPVHVLLYQLLFISCISLSIFQINLALFYYVLMSLEISSGISGKHFVGL